MKKDITKSQDACDYCGKTENYGSGRTILKCVWCHKDVCNDHSLRWNRSWFPDLYPQRALCTEHLPDDIKAKVKRSIF